MQCQQFKYDPYIFLQGVHLPATAWKNWQASQQARRQPSGPGANCSACYFEWSWNLNKSWTGRELIWNTICITDRIQYNLTTRKCLEEPGSSCGYDYQLQPPVDLQEPPVHRPHHQGLVHSLCLDTQPEKIQSRGVYFPKKLLTCGSETWCSLPCLQTGQTRATPSSSSSGSSSGNRACRHSSTGVNNKQQSNNSVGSQICS